MRHARSTATNPADAPPGAAQGRPARTALPCGASTAEAEGGQTTGTDEPLVDFDRMAATFDLVAPLIAPVTEALLDALPDLDTGSVVDVGCGTGEPGLTLARRRPQVRVLGVDPSPAMVEIARAKAVGHPNLAVAVAPAEALPVADASTRAVVSRFGLLAFGDADRSAAEVARVLEPGGTVSLATWGRGGMNPLARTAVEAFGDDLPPEARGLLAAPDADVEHRRRLEVLHRAGLQEVASEEFRWVHRFEDIDAVWRLVSGPALLARVFALVSPSVVESTRARLTTRVAEHRRPDGSYLLPQSCLLYRGSAGRR